MAETEKNTASESGGVFGRGVATGLHRGWGGGLIRKTTGLWGDTDFVGVNDDTEDDRKRRTRILAKMWDDPEKREQANTILSSATGQAMTDENKRDVLTQALADENKGIMNAFEQDADLQKKLMDMWLDDGAVQQSGGDREKLNHMRNIAAFGRGTGEYASDAAAIAGGGAALAGIGALLPVAAPAAGVAGALAWGGRLGVSALRAGKHLTPIGSGFKKAGAYGSAPIAGGGINQSLNAGDYSPDTSIEDRVGDYQTGAMFGGAATLAPAAGGALLKGAGAATRATGGYLRSKFSGKDIPVEEAAKDPTNFFNLLTPKSQQEFFKRGEDGAVGTARLDADARKQAKQFLGDIGQEDSRAFNNLAAASDLETAGAAARMVDDSVDAKKLDDFAKTDKSDVFGGNLRQHLKSRFDKTKKEIGAMFDEVQEATGNLRLDTPKFDSVGLTKDEVRSNEMWKLLRSEQMTIKDAMRLRSELVKTFQKPIGKIGTSGHVVGDYITQLDDAIEKALDSSDMAKHANQYKAARGRWKKEVGRVYRSPWLSKVMRDDVPLAGDDSKVISDVIDKIASKNNKDLTDLRLLYGDDIDPVIDQIGESFLRNKLSPSEKALRLPGKGNITDRAVDAFISGGNFRKMIMNSIGRAVPAKNYLLDRVKGRASEAAELEGAQPEQYAGKIADYIDKLDSYGGKELMDEGKWKSLTRLRDALKEGQNFKVKEGDNEFFRILGGAVKSASHVFLWSHHKQRIPFIAGGLARGAIRESLKVASARGNMAKVISVMESSPRLQKALKSGQFHKDMIEAEVAKHYPEGLPTAAAFAGVGKEKIQNE